MVYLEFGSGRVGICFACLVDHMAKVGGDMTKVSSQTTNDYSGHNYNIINVETIFCQTEWLV